MDAVRRHDDGANVFSSERLRGKKPKSCKSLKVAQKQRSNHNHIKSVESKVEAAGRQHQRGSKSILAEEALTVFCLKIFFTITLKAVREKIQLIISMMMKQNEELFTTSLSWHSFSAGGKSTSVLWADWWRAAAASVRMFRLWMSSAWG